MESLTEEQIQQLEDELKIANDLLTQREKEIFEEEKECALIEEKILSINRLKSQMSTAINEISTSIDTINNWYTKQDLQDRTELDVLIKQMSKNINFITDSLDEKVEAISKTQSLTNKSLPRMNSRNFYEPSSY